MVEGNPRQGLRRAAQAAGAACLLASAITLCTALAGRAQDIRHDEARASIDACLEAHFDSPRYAADLASEGWVVLPAADRAAAIDAIADAIAPVVDDAFDWTAPDAAERRALMRADFNAFAQDRALFDHPLGDLMILATDTGEGGLRRVRCIRVNAGDSVDRAIDLMAGIEGSALPPHEERPGGIRALVFGGPLPDRPDIDFSMGFASVNPVPDIDPPLLANEAFLLEIVFTIDTPVD